MQPIPLTQQTNRFSRYGFNGGNNKIAPSDGHGLQALHAGNAATPMASGASTGALATVETANFGKKGGAANDEDEDEGEGDDDELDFPDSEEEDEEDPEITLLRQEVNTVNFDAALPKEKAIIHEDQVRGAPRILSILYSKFLYNMNIYGYLVLRIIKRVGRE